MEGKSWWEALVESGRDIRMMISLYFLVSLGSLFVVVFASGQLANETKLSVAAFIILVAVVALIWNDGAIRDAGLGVKDMDSDFAATRYGKSLAKAPFAAFRILSFIVVAGIAATQVIALYSA